MGQAGTTKAEDCGTSGAQKTGGAKRKTSGARFADKYKRAEQLAMGEKKKNAVSQQCSDKSAQHNTQHTSGVCCSHNSICSVVFLVIPGPVHVQPQEFSTYKRIPLVSPYIKQINRTRSPK